MALFFTVGILNLEHWTWIEFFILIKLGLTLELNNYSRIGHPGKYLITGTFESGITLA